MAVFQRRLLNEPGHNVPPDKRASQILWRPRRHTAAGLWAVNESLVTDYLARKSVRKRGHDDDGDEFEMVPDHEFPEDTAMWRECFD